MHAEDLSIGSVHYNSPRNHTAQHRTSIPPAWVPNTMSDHFSDSDSDDLETRSDDSGEGGNTMMSLLSSYYGIEEETKPGQSEEQNCSDIDAVGFNHQDYVKNLLLTTEVQVLLKEDIKMVHDIKTLDSDMQMLVYENYNKFISATETIKKMKTNVEAMDDDMESVRVKMESITKKTADIDQSLSLKRSKIDKLVRIKRLLNRLEFLSELPERLEKMIEEEMYKAAIQLYKKTVTVLTKQSHVLSFKKIQEKTECMMQELQKKVLSLFDSRILEAQQLTQYVGILRMMECPRDVVIQKFLAAHKYRSLKMIKTFMTETTAAIEAHNSGTVSSSGSTGEDNSESGDNDKKNVLTVGYVRTFHQSLVVGLIESSKGIREMFYDDEAQGDSVESEGTGISRAAAYDELQAMIGIVMPEYVQCILKPLNHFFSKYEDMYKKAEEDTGTDNSVGAAVSESDPTENIDGSTDRTSTSSHDKRGSTSSRMTPRGVVLPELEEERGVWIALTRQLILDCQYLDSGTESCRPPECDASLPHADGVAESVLAVLDEHYNSSFSKRLKYLENAMLAAIPELQDCSNCRKALAAEIESHDAPSARSVFSSQMGRSMGIMERLLGTFDDVFGDVCKDGRQVVDTHAVTRVGVADSSAKLMLRYCNAVAEMAEEYGGAAMRPFERSEIYSESVTVQEAAYHAPASEKDAAMCLLAAVMFSKLLPTLTGRLEVALRANDMSATTTSVLRERCSSRLEGSSMLLLEAFSTYHANAAVSTMHKSVKAAAQTDTRARDTLIDPRDLTVTSHMVDFAQTADNLTLFCCVILNEAPPAPQIRSKGGTGSDTRGGDVMSGGGRRSSMTSRGGTSGYHQGGQPMYNYGLQLDIERMFSRKIKVYDIENLSLSLEGILGLVMKASLKASLEAMRTYTLGKLSYTQLAIDFTFIRQIMGSFLKDSADIDGLSEEVFGTLSARSVDENCENELPVVLPRAVSDGLYMAGKRCVLLHR